MRGHEEDPIDWRATNVRQAIAADIMLNYWTVISGHNTGLNVGYSDGSARFLAGDTPIIFFGRLFPFLEQLKTWQPDPGGPIGNTWHLTAYKFFDTQ